MSIRRSVHARDLLAAVIVTAAIPAAAIPAGAQANAADVAFMQGMIGHHAQAITMAAMIPTRTNRRDIELIGERIAVSQQDEIALMKAWLERNHEQVPDPGAHAQHAQHAQHGGMAMPGDTLMPGMLTDAELAQLAASRGDAFDRLFLRDMIRHHTGALTMVARLFASQGAAQDPEIFRFASDVDADQRAEIARMQQVLDKLTAAAGGR